MVRLTMRMLWGGGVMGLFRLRACPACRQAAALLPPRDEPRERTMNVLVWSNNNVLSDLVARNLSRRGFDVHERRLPPCSAQGRLEHNDADLVIVDLDWLEPELWRRASLLRKLLPGVPLVILGHAWPTSPRVDRLQPCTYVREPFAIDALLAAVQDVASKPCASP
jgi:DNA-binding response OmpR family regulator